MNSFDADEDVMGEKEALEYKSIKSRDQNVFMMKKESTANKLVNSIATELDKSEFFEEAARTVAYRIWKISFPLPTLVLRTCLIDFRSMYG